MRPDGYIKKEKLQKLIKEYNVEDTFFLLGKKENPYPYIKNADYFCLLSEFEGYGKDIITGKAAIKNKIEKYDNQYILEEIEKILEE